MKSDLTSPAGYAELLKEIKERVRAAQVRAGLAANRELLALYWDIGRMILARQEAEGWGAKVIDRLSRDLHAAFPGQQGFSPRNLKYMRAFADAWPDPQFVQQPAAQIPWTHHCMLLDKVQTRPTASGTRPRPSRTAGRAMSLPCKSSPRCTRGRAGR